MRDPVSTDEVERATMDNMQICTIIIC